MITSLKIENFQSHKLSELEFSEGVNIIVGSSDSGKTAIIRAIRWLTFNKPSGDEMRSNWGGDTSVSICTPDQYFCRNKTKGGNEYILDGLSFKAFGTEVPAEITKDLNLNTINIQQQLDSPFLLSETPGAVAAHWNKVAHLEKIDTGLQNINSSIRELTSDIKYAEGQKLSLVEELTKFEYLEKFEVEVEVLEGMDKHLVKNCANSYKLGKLLTSYKTNEETILEYKETLELEEPVNNILSLIELGAEADLKEVKLDKLVCQIKEVQTEIEDQRWYILIETPLLVILKLYKDKEEVDNQRKNLFKTISGLNNIKTRLTSAKALQTSLQDKFEEAMPIGSICPLCNQRIK